MANPTFGSPQLDDATAKLERKINESAQRMVETVRRVGSQIMNRPLGSVPVKPEDQVTDFQQVYLDPQALMKMHTERMAQMGRKQGTVDFIRWYKKNLKRLEDGRY